LGTEHELVVIGGRLKGGLIDERVLLGKFATPANALDFIDLVELFAIGTTQELNPVAAGSANDSKVQLNVIAHLPHREMVKQRMALPQSNNGKANPQHACQKKAQHTFG
jgi:hypothetical protein